MKQFVLVLLSTFVMGILSGVFVYFISSLDGPILSFGGDGGGRGGSTFAVTADAYGGCQMLGSCPSYRITSDGSYIYLISHRDARDERYAGSLSSSVRNRLRDAIEDTSFVAVMDSTATSCEAARDGISYRYDITISDAIYTIDTCTHDAEAYEVFEILEEILADISRTHQ